METRIRLLFVCHEITRICRVDFLMISQWDSQNPGLAITMILDGMPNF